MRKMHAPAAEGMAPKQLASSRRAARAKQPPPSRENPGYAPDIVRDTIRRPGTPLDAVTRTFMESYLGESVGHVRVHTDDLAAASAEAVDAAAYTVGGSVVFGAGRYAPHRPEGRMLVVHELVHTLQQRGTGAPSSHDALPIEPAAGAAEREAAQVGSLRSPARRIRTRLRAAAVQRAVPTWGGEWSTDNYDAVKDVDSQGNAVPAAQNARGADITLRFKPNSQVNAELLGLSQSVQSYVAGALAPTPAAATRGIPAADAVSINTGRGETDVGTAIDRASGYNNPIYPVQTPASKSLSDPNTDAGWGQLGWRYTDRANVLQKQDATLIDRPRRYGADKNSRQMFEVAALATKGVDAGTFYGSVRWGWRTDGAAALTKIDLQKVSDGAPSSTFLKAASIWDKGKSSTGKANVPFNAPQVMVTIAPVMLTPDAVVMLPFRLPTGTRVRVLSGFGPPFLPNVGRVEVVDGPHTGIRGAIDEASSFFPVLAAERP